MSDEIWLRLTEGDKRVDAVCANDFAAVQEMLRVAWLALPSQVAKRNADIERVKAAAHAMSEGRLDDADKAMADFGSGTLRSPCADDCTHPSHRHAALD